jgi:(p)ppGpp synthase/HD superfamily hydrolase
MSLLEKAIGISVAAHRGQTDKSGAPYIMHPLRVMGRMDNDTDRIVAVLHDVIEDTKTTADDLHREGFPDEILQALAHMTKNDGELYNDFVARAASNPIALRVKLADLEDNMDVRRLESVTERDAKRLTKYLVAWRYLKTVPPFVPGVLYGPDEG